MVRIWLSSVGRRKRVGHTGANPEAVHRTLGEASAAKNRVIPELAKATRIALLLTESRRILKMPWCVASASREARIGRIRR
jgi:hypothetical protein